MLPWNPNDVKKTGIALNKLLFCDKYPLKFFKLLNSIFELKKYNMVIKTPIFITKIILLLTSKTLKLNIIKNTNITTTKYPITPLLSK